MLKQIGRIIIAGIIAVVVLSVFCVLYGYSGVHIPNPSGATDYTWESKQIKTTMVEGLSWFRMDEYGFNNAAGVSPEQPDILLMGSSHMEAVEVDDTENTGYLLNQMLEGLTTYNIGTSGHTIVHCVDNLKNAVSYYQPQKFVIIETNEINPKEKEMQAVIDGEFADIPSYNSGALYFLQKNIPAVKSVYKSLQDWRSNLSSGEGEGSEGGEDEEESKTYEKTIYRFLELAAKSVGDAKLIIFYNPSAVIDENGQIKGNEKQAELALFKEACEASGIIFVDMTGPFDALYDNEHRLAHGFVNTAVGAGHLNKYGHKVVAETLTEVIKNCMEDENVAQ